MSEFRGTTPGEVRQRISHEPVPLADGPITVYLADKRLQIIDPGRDLDPALTDLLNPRIDCLVVDPLQYDLRQRTGYKALRDGERIALGRAHKQGRFTFSGYVSARHASMYRYGDTIEITDLDSTNGTFLVRKPPQETPGQTLADTIPGPEEPLPRQAGTYEVAGYSDADFRRPDVNEDAFFIDIESRALGVFDGMGGHAGSEEASAIAAASVEQSLRDVPLAVPRSIGELAIREALEKAHEAIIRHGGVPGIGTTAVIAKIFEAETGDPYAMIGSAGDSRVYLIRGGQIEHVTLDHVFTGLNPDRRRSLQETLSQATDLSKLTNQERSMFMSRNIIDSCLGVNGNNSPTISVTDLGLQPGDRLLLTSDGIHDNLTDNEIEEVISGHSELDLGVTIEDLVIAARLRSREQGHPRAKPDDMTAVMLTYER